VRILDEEDARVTEAFGRLGELAASYGITPSIEFTGYRLPGMPGRTRRIIEGAGRGTMTIDPLHIVRTGASLDEMRGMDPGLFGYVQLCDGPLTASEAEYGHEAAYERLPPGEGEFPLAEILALAPAGRPVSLEVPSQRLREEGASAAARAERAVNATRRLLAELEPETV
jgi:sugar phosphate isomerase/epimerase